MAKAKEGLLTNVSKNPVVLDDGRTLPAGESFEDYDFSAYPLEDNMFARAGALISGSDAKALQSQLDTAGTEKAELEGKVEELQKAVADLTARAEKAEADLETEKAKAKK